MSKLKEKLQAAASGKKKTAMLVGMTVFLVVIGGTMLFLLKVGKEEAVVYKEAQVTFGLLAAGVTETGSVDVGTVTQSFELDLSQFTGESSLSFGNTASGMGNMSGMELMGGVNNASQSASTSSRILEIEEVYIEAGEEITEGTPLLKLTQDSVDSIRNSLQEDVISAQLVYEQAVTAGKQTTLEAESAYKTNTLYGEYGQAEYDQTIKELQDAVEAKQETLTEKEEALLEAQEDLTAKQTLLAEQKQVLQNAEFTEAGTDERADLYWWIIAWQTKEDAAAMVETLEENLENLETSITDYEAEIETAKTELALAQKALESGTIEAESQLKIRTFQAENAQEIYDVAISQGEFETENAKEDYEEAKTKLEEFDAQIVDQVIYASSNGLVTDVYIAAGDTLSQNMELISMNDYDAVTITLSIEEEDMESARVGNQVNVTVAAFPEEVFTGEVTEIGDAEIDSNTNKTLYSVTVTVQSTGDILYQDMTAEVTFLTEETAEVLFVPERALTQENGRSYVKVKKEDGTIEKREVKTGISDGVNIEIKEGLSEGETVLWESKVKQS